MSYTINTGTVNFVLPNITTTAATLNCSLNVSTSVSANSNTVTIGSGIVSTQGCHISWNRSGTQGETYILNQKGAGTGSSGIVFGKVTTGNVATEQMRIADNNNITAVGSFTAATLSADSLSIITGYPWILTS